ncbi:MAG: hypothetical protein HUU01_02865 [Saprospiraceae bacterium]|nr:hypothetical protein [Saprospiraceae bacterium]
MEDNQFWDELANRLRQEQPQPFREEDWAAVHQRIQKKGSSRPGWFWPLMAGLVLIGNNLVWYLLWPGAAMASSEAPAAIGCDTVVLIRERVIRDTIWQKIPPQPLKPAKQRSPLRHQPAITVAPDAMMKTAASPEIQPDVSASTAVPRSGMGALPRLPIATFSFLQPERSGLLAPFRASILPARSNHPLIAKPTTRLLINAEAGGAAFLPEKISRMHLWQGGATIYLMPGKWGVSAGLYRLHATENPPETGPKLGWSAECPTCPASPDFPGKVSLQWTEFQVGLAYRFALPIRKTEILLSAAGQLRSPATQFRHFRFENYGGPLVEMDDRNREESGLYWNGWSSRVTVVHRITRNFGVSAGVQGRWSGGVNPGIMPASLGLNAGLVWYASD